MFFAKPVRDFKHLITTNCENMNRTRPMFFQCKRLHVYVLQ
jgi:hypothetical protein